MKLFKKNRKAGTAELLITYRWMDEEKTVTEHGNSAGLASLLADPCVDVLKVEKMANVEAV